MGTCTSASPALIDAATAPADSKYNISHETSSIQDGNSGNGGVVTSSSEHSSSSGDHDQHGLTWKGVKLSKPQPTATTKPTPAHRNKPSGSQSMTPAQRQSVRRRMRRGLRRWILVRKELLAGVTPQFGVPDDNDDSADATTRQANTSAHIAELLDSRESLPATLVFAIRNQYALMSAADVKLELLKPPTGADVQSRTATEAEVEILQLRQQLQAARLALRTSLFAVGSIIPSKLQRLRELKVRSQTPGLFCVSGCTVPHTPHSPMPPFLWATMWGRSSF